MICFGHSPKTLPQPADMEDIAPHPLEKYDIQLPAKIAIAISLKTY
jgi:hypothetical protein